MPNAPPETGERLKVTDAATYLGLRAATLNKWGCHGDGPPFIKVGRLVRYRRWDLDAFILGRLRTSTSDMVPSPRGKMRLASLG